MPLVCWGKTAENMATYLGKGSRIAVEGRLQVRKWQGEDGKARSKMEVVAERVTFMESRPREGISPGKAEGSEEVAPEVGMAKDPGAAEAPLYDDSLGRVTGTYDPKVPF